LTQEEKGKETKLNILKSALECFSKKGYEETQVDEICQQAGVTKGAFYYHFATKQDILLLLLNQWMEKIGNLLNDAKLESNDLLSAIINLPKKVKPVFLEDLNQIVIFLEFYIKGINNPNLKEVVSKSYKDYLDFFSEIIKEGIAKGYIRNTNPRTTARLLFALTIGLLIQGLIDPEGEDWEAFAIDCLKLLFK